MAGPTQFPMQAGPAFPVLVQVWVCVCVCPRAEVGVGGKAGAATSPQTSAKVPREDPQHLGARVPESQQGPARAQRAPGPVPASVFALARSRRVKVRGGLRRAHGAATRARGGPARTATPSLRALLSSQSPPRFLHRGGHGRVPFPGSRRRCHGGLQQVLDGAKLLNSGCRVPGALPAPSAAPRLRLARVRRPVAAPLSRPSGRFPRALPSLPGARRTGPFAPRGQTRIGPAAAAARLQCQGVRCDRVAGVPCAPCAPAGLTSPFLCPWDWDSSAPTSKPVRLFRGCRAPSSPQPPPFCINFLGVF